MKHLGDITKLNGANVPPVNIIIGGSPCQDLSVAGTQKGLDGERSVLFLDQIRIVKEMRAKHGKPRFMVWENVPGAFSSNKGADFRSVLTECARIAEPQAPVVPQPKNGWPTAGCLNGVGGKWSIAWRVFDAQFWGVPQRRRRISLVCDFGGMSAPEILFERESLSRNTNQSRTARKSPPPPAKDSINSASEQLAYCIQGNCIDRAAYNQGINAKYDMGIDENGTAYTVVAKGPGAVCIGNGQTDQLKMSDKVGALDCMHDQKAVMTYPNGIVRRITPLECERLQGFPMGWTDIGDWTDSGGKVHKTTDSARYKALGNSISIPNWFYVLSKLCVSCGADVTMASLFDGIGGFPLIWQALGGIPVWSSEIEEFCIAVTKLRFGDD